MGRKKTPGLYKRGEFWHIDKQVFGERIRESTGSDSLEEAEKYLARRIETLRQVAVYGARPKRIFREAATKFLAENQQKMLQLIGANPRISKRAMATATGISTTSIDNNLAILKSKGLLQRVGSARSGHWELIAGSKTARGRE